MVLDFLLSALIGALKIQNIIEKIKFYNFSRGPCISDRFSKSSNCLRLTCANELQHKYFDVKPSDKRLFTTTLSTAQYHHDGTIDY